MNNHKFRAWDDTLLRYLPPMTIEEIGKCNMNGTNWYQLTLEQWTGLYDKNGTEIYVGDIVRNTIGKLEKIVFVNGSFQCANLEYPNSNLYLLDAYASFVEIIGHIHEGDVF